MLTMLARLKIGRNMQITMPPMIIAEKWYMQKSITAM